MDTRIERASPMRTPLWRYQRVIEMVGYRPQPLLPTADDDHPIRLARRVLLELEAARDEPLRIAEIRRAEADMCHALMISYSQDAYVRHALEAYLLLPELSFGEIATRFATSAQTVSFFHDLFFDVRPYLAHSIWVQKIIRGDFDPVGQAKTAADAFGYVLKLFAYRGGHYVLEAAINRLSAGEKPKTIAEVAPWIEKAFGGLVQSAAVAAAVTMPIDSKNGLRLIKIALQNHSAGRIDEAAEAEFDKWFDSMKAAVDTAMRPWKRPDADSHVDQSEKPEAAAAAFDEDGQSTNDSTGATYNGPVH